MRKLILRTGLPPGDVVMLTAAVRDLHRYYPGRYQTDVRTRCPELWEHNPYLTQLSENDAEVEHIECHYPLINRCNEVPYHCLHGFVEFLNERLRLAIRLTASKGDIHLSAQEKSWYSQVHELTGEDTPFWIVAAGGKYDVTVKWWDTCRYQAVVDHFRGKILFIQVGEYGHHHPKLDGVIDLRGKTTLRELVRLVYHAQGVLCPITCLMHLAAAVATKPRRPRIRPCVVIAGGREPAHWEAYPGHQFIHLNGALPCCPNGGCWKDRTLPLRDGQNRDVSHRLCCDVVEGSPRCMHLITPDEVIRRIETYYSGGVLKPLSPAQQTAAERGAAATANNDYDRMPLNFQSAGLACDRFVESIPECPNHYAGRGIVICAGGMTYFTNAWVCINMLRRHGCWLPIQVWHLGSREMNPSMKGLLEPLGVKCVDAYSVRRKFPARILAGWPLKPYAMLHCPFREVMLLDADNVPVANPELLFDTPEFRKTGAIFWPDHVQKTSRERALIWRNCGLRRPREPEFETGQIVVDKERCWRALRLCLWFNENSDFYYQHLYGDKETFHLAFQKALKAYTLVSTPILTLDGTMCQHDFQGRRIFQHRQGDKWDFLLHNRRVKHFWFENHCRNYVKELQRAWDGKVRNLGNETSPLTITRLKRKAPSIEAVIISQPERTEIRERTLRNLAASDWGSLPVRVCMDGATGANRHKQQTDVAFLALKSAREGSAEYVLLLDDDVMFNRYLRYNLQHWRPLRARAIAVGGLHNPRLRELACDVRNNCRFVAPGSTLGNPAYLVSRSALTYILAHWNEAKGKLGIKIARFASRLEQPILYHAPSLVQHRSTQNPDVGARAEAFDFDLIWKASSSAPTARPLRVPSPLERRSMLSVGGEKRVELSGS